MIELKQLGKGWAPYESCRGPAVLREMPDKSSAWIVTKLKDRYLAEYLGAGHGEVPSSIKPCLLSVEATGETAAAALRACASALHEKLDRAVLALTEEAARAKALIAPWVDP